MSIRERLAQFLIAIIILPNGQAAMAEINTNGMMEAVETCYLGSDPFAGVPECVGWASSMCQEANSYTTNDVVDCIAFETSIWDEYLNLIYNGQREELQQRDLDNPGRINRADALLAAQRAWITFRDEECSLRYAMHQDGTIRSIIHADCIMNHTARRLFELRTVARG